MNLLRRFPPTRWLILQHRKQIRQKRRDASWIETQAVLVSLGNITIAWAGINLILNSFIEAHWHQLGPATKGKELPRSFTGKLDYLKQLERDQRWDSTRLTEFRQMRLELADLNQRRINVVHGFLMRRGYGPRWTIHIAKEVDDRLHRDNLPHSSQEVHQLNIDLNDILRRLSIFFRPMLGK